MKSYNEIAQSVLSRRDEFEEKKRIRRKLINKNGEHTLKKQNISTYKY